jgi:hypothetical protein
MTTDLDDRIRAALRERAAAVTPARTMERVECAPRRWVAPVLAAAAAVVLAVAVAVAISVHRGSGSGTGAPAAGGPAYAGYQWRVTSLQDHDGLLQVPPDIDATVSFTADGSVYADDTVNHLAADYLVGESAYTVEHADATLVGYDGSDRARSRVIAAVDALFFSGSGAVPNGRQVVTILAAVQGDTLTLKTAGIDIMTVTLERQGPVADQPTALPSGTSQALDGVPSSAAATDLPHSGTAGP